MSTEWEDGFDFDGRHYRLERSTALPKPVQDPHPPCWMAATSDGSAAVAGHLGLGLLSFSILQPLDRMSQHIAQYREAAANPDPITRVTTNKVAAYTLVHCADTMEQCEANGIWDSVWWWYKNLAEFTLEWEFPNFPEEERDKIFPLLKRQIEGNFEAQEFSDADMIIVGDPSTACRRCRTTPTRRRPADLLRAVRDLNTRRSCARSSCSAPGGHPELERRDVVVDASVRAT